MKNFSEMSAFVLLFFGIVASVTAISGSGSGSGYLEACNNAYDYIEYTGNCAAPIRAAVAFYMLPDSAFDSSGSGSGSGYNFDLWSGSGNDDWSWNICGDPMEFFDDCMEILTDYCSNEDLLSELPDMISGYKSQFCSGGDLQEYIEEYEEALDTTTLISIVLDADCDDPSEVINYFVEGGCHVNWDDFDFSGSVLDVRVQATAAYRGIFSCVREELASCSNLEDMVPLAFFLYSQTLIPGFDVDFEEVMAGFDNSGVNPNSDARSTVAVFGDPHLRVYGATEAEYTTCASPGETSYLSNSFVVIVGTNTVAEVGEEATFMTAVNIEVYNGERGDDRTLMARYSAGDSSLPTDFESTDSDSDVAIADLGSNTIRISGYASGLAITIKRIQHTYMMVIRMSDTVLAQSTGLLFAGCPADEQIDRDGTEVRRRRRDVDICGTDNYASACEYDLDVTGDATLAAASVESMAELTSNTEELDSELSEDDDSGAVTLATSPLLLIITAVALVVTSLM